MKGRGLREFHAAMDSSSLAKMLANEEEVESRPCRSPACDTLAKSQVGTPSKNAESPEQSQGFVLLYQRQGPVVNYSYVTLLQVHCIISLYSP